MRRESRIFDQRFECAIAREKAAAIRPVVRLVGDVRFNERACHKSVVVDSIFGQVPVVAEHYLKVRKKILIGIKQFAEVIEAFVRIDRFCMFVFHGGHYTIF